MRKHSSFKKVLLASLNVSGVIVISTTVHEFLHFVVGKSFGIPAKFLNLTAVGIPKEEIANYSGFALLLMNGVAPVFSILVFGILGYFLMKHRNPSKRALVYSLSWIVMLNLPYLGLQLLLIATRARLNGTGNDFAAISGYFGISVQIRAIFGVFGYFVFLGLIVPLKQFLSPIGIYQPEKVFRVKKSAGVASLILGFVTVFLGNFELGIGNESGMPLIFFGSTAFSAIGFALLIEWKSDHVKRIYREWILPGILGSLLLVPIGIINGNDYAIFLLIVLPTILGAAFFATHEFPWPKFSNHEG